MKETLAYSIPQRKHTKLKLPYASGMVATLASRVQQRMDQLGLKPVHLAAKVPGMSESAISQFLRGITKGLKPHNLVDIAQALGCTERYLVYGTEPASYPAAITVTHTAREPVPALQLTPPPSIRSTIAALGDALDLCNDDNRKAVAGLLAQYAVSPKPGGVADAIVMLLERCAVPTADNPYPNATPTAASKRSGAKP